MRPSQLPKRGTADRGYGARRLLAAVLDRALKDAFGPGENRGAACTIAERERAIEWFNDDGRGPGTFRWVCALLELDAGAVRHSMNRR